MLMPMPMIMTVFSRYVEMSPVVRSVFRECRIVQSTVLVYAVGRRTRAYVMIRLRMFFTVLAVEEWLLRGHC